MISSTKTTFRLILQTFIMGALVTYLALAYQHVVAYSAATYQIASVPQQNSNFLIVSRQ